MFGTFWIWYRSSFLDSNNIPMYSNIVKCEVMQFTIKVGQARNFQLKISEEQFLTKTSIEKADNGVAEAFIPSVNDYVDIFYARGNSGTNNPNTWINIFNGIIGIQPYLMNIDSARYSLDLISNDLLSSNKVIGNAINDGVNFQSKNTKDIIETILKVQQNSLIKSTQYKVVFDDSIKNKLIQTSGGVRTNANRKVESVLQDILKANQLQLFISRQNNGEAQTVKYHITDKYYNPDYTKPFFELTQANCKIFPRVQRQPMKQANRFFYNAGTQNEVDIDSKLLTNRSLVFYGDTFFNLSGIAGVIDEEKIDNSFLDADLFNRVKKIRKGQSDIVFSSKIKDIANKLGFNKVKNDLIEMSVIQLKLVIDDFEIPKELQTTDGNVYWKNSPAVLDIGMRFILNLQNFNYSQEMLITEINCNIEGEKYNMIIDCIPMSILDAKLENFTLPNLKTKFKAENNNREPTALEMMQYIYKNADEPEARFQLGLVNPLQYGSLTKNTQLINTTRILTT